MLESCLGGDERMFVPENPTPDAPEAFTPAPSAAPAPMFAPPSPSPAAPAAPSRSAPAYGHPGATPQAPGAWAPPPKPGLIPLRPLGLGVILSASFVVLRKSPGATLVPALLLSLSAAAIGAALTWLPFGDDPVAFSLQTNAQLVLGLLIEVVIAGITALAVSRGALGERLRLRALFVRAKGRDKVLVGWGALVALLVGSGYVIMGVALASGVSAPFDSGVLGRTLILTLLVTPALFVLLVWLQTKFAFVPSLLLVERVRLGTAIRRSWRLTRGAAFFWRILGIRLLVGAMLAVAAAVVSFPFGLIFGLGGSLLFPNGGGQGAEVLPILSSVMLAVVSGFTAAISSVVAGATTALLYLDTRMRREGLDLELARYVEAGADSSVDPYLPKAV